MASHRRTKILVVIVLLLSGSTFGVCAGDSDKSIRRRTEGQGAPGVAGSSQAGPGQAAESSGKVLRGLIIGINRFQDAKIRELRYCRSDAEAVNALVSDRRYSPFEDVKVRMLTDEEATAGSVRKELEALGRSAAPDDTVLVYFSSHGMQQDGNKTFWVLNDTRVDMEAYGRHDLRLQPQTALEQTEISRLFAAIRARRLVVFVDSCFSAATVISYPRGQEFNWPETRNPFAAFTGEGRVVLTASEGSQLSAEVPGLKHGAFTYYLIEGLRGAADANHDNVVELWEIWQYLERKVTEAAKSQRNPQNPTISTLHLTHGFPLTTYPLSGGPAASGSAAPGRPPHGPTQGLGPEPGVSGGSSGATGKPADSLPLTWVTVSSSGGRSIGVSATEITNRQFLEFVRANGEWARDRIADAYHDGDYLRNWPAPDRYPEGLDDHPVTYVSWFAAKAFADWIGARLPSESEWKSAASGESAAGLVNNVNTPRLFPWGNEWNPALCNNRDTGHGAGVKTMPVISFEAGASPWGREKIYNMAGNVWEWSEDLVFERQTHTGQKSVAVVPVGPEEKTSLVRLIKGGSFLTDRLGCSIASRNWADPRLCAEDGGFRVVRARR